MQGKTGRRESQQISTTMRVLTLQGLVKLRDDLKGEDPEVVRLVREQNKDVCFRDGHGSLRRVFPKHSGDLEAGLHAQAANKRG